jgi:DNA mismatch repair ATPase MutS
MMLAKSIILIVLVGTVCLLGLIKRRRKRIEKQYLEESWGRRIERYRNINHIAKFAAWSSSSHSYNLTPQTLLDIDIESVFAFVDRSETTVGQQCLFSKLVKPSLSLKDLNSLKLANEFFSNDDIQKKARSILSRFERKGTNLIADFFDPELIVIKTKDERVFRFLSALALLCSLLCWLYPVIAIPMLFLFGVNLMIHVVHRHNHSNAIRAIRQVYQLMKTSEKLMKLDSPVDSDQIPAAHGKLTKFQRVYRLLDLGIPSNDVSSILFYGLDLLKAFFLIEVQLLKSANNEIISNKAAVSTYFEYLGKVEIALSVASLNRDNTITTCTPIFSEGGKFHCHGLVHPLVENCVANSIELDEKGAFITGSNMSGKSTFLRTVVLNSVLAQSLNVCFAESISLPLVKSYSSIKIADDLEDAESYYSTEVSVIHEMVLSSVSGSNNLFVIDEIFKGTNTLERIALSKAILNYLHRAGNLVIASSHDLELIELLGEDYRIYHFEESIRDENFHFDYKIKDGPLKAGNAIKLLGVAGFPAEVIDEAESYAGRFKKTVI